MSNTETISQADTDYLSFKTYTTYYLLGYAFIFGGLIIFAPKENSMLDFFLGFPFLVFTLRWCAIDAQERNESLSLIFKFGLILVLFIALPCYIFVTRGVQGFRLLGKVAVITFLIAFFIFAGSVAATLLFGGNVLIN